VITFYQIDEMNAAWHDAANAFQRLGVALTPVERKAAYAMFHKAVERYNLAKANSIATKDEP
jgi:hypothetical protein